MQPLDDITVIDLSLTLPGPYATWVLSELGADVVSVEPPDGDPIRHWEPSLPDSRSEVFAMLQESKETVAIDLKDERGRDLLAAMSDDADVVVEGFRPGVVDSLGVGPETLRERNPDLIYCSLSGFGQTGPRADQPGHSLNYEGLAGLLDPKDPSLPGYPVADFAGAQMLVIAVLAALRGRDRGAGGRYVDLGLYEALASWNAWNAPWADRDDGPSREPLVGGEYPCYNTYETADGRYLTLGVMEPPFWETLCERLDRPDLVDAQFETGGTDSDAYRELQGEFEQRPLDAWLDRLGGDLPVGPVRSPAEAMTDPQLDAREHAVAVDGRTGDLARTFDLPVTFSEPAAEGGDEPAKSDSAGRSDGADRPGVAGLADYDESRLASLRMDGVLDDERE
jgi:crotonobetainyl-CoA:carnitine CoA-transferase CaiB-like acyl-CoA transferase